MRSILMSSVFQTPSAGRWVLQLEAMRLLDAATIKFQTPSAGRWVLQLRQSFWWGKNRFQVSNPISGEVGAAAK